MRNGEEFGEEKRKKTNILENIKVLNNERIKS